MAGPLSTCRRVDPDRPMTRPRLRTLLAGLLALLLVALGPGGVPQAAAGGLVCRWERILWVEGP